MSTPPTDRPSSQAPAQLLQKAVEQSVEGVLITDPQGAIIYVNPAFEKLYGYQIDEVLGQNPRLLKSGLHPPEFYQHLWEALKAGQSWQGRITNCRKDGQLVNEKTIISPMLDEQGVCIAYIAVKQDIGRELELEAQLLGAQKMELVGQLAGGIAHDFNNLLQTVLGYANLIDENLDNDSLMRGDLAHIREAADKAASLTRQMLAFSRRQVIKPQELNLNALIKEHVELIRPMLGEAIALSLAFQNDLPAVKVDSGQIEQVLMNLCINARDAMPAGGALRISTRTTEIDAQQQNEQPWLTQGFYVLLRVEDNGQGMSSEVLSHVFEPFFTTKEVGRGSGLGLSTAYGIIKQHSGFIFVRSELGRGSQFDILLPSAPLDLSISPTPQDLPKQQDQRGGQETILLAEDEDLVRRMAVRVLRRAGYNVLTASDGAEAVRLFQACQGQVDLCLFDVIMPQKGGQQAAAELRASKPELPVLFMSGHDLHAHYKEFMSGPKDSFLQKPFRPKVLLQRLREIFGDDQKGPAKTDDLGVLS